MSNPSLLMLAFEPPPADHQVVTQFEQIMLIALVLAIAVPISLFIGAVIGFIVRARM
jgi:hypothetical protein